MSNRITEAGHSSNTVVVGSCFSSGEWYVGKLFPLPDIYCDGKKVANISKELPIEEREANARLMAAAPELLRTLDAMACKFWKYCEGSSEDAVIYAEAKGAIKKALGLS